MMALPPGCLCATLNHDAALLRVWHTWLKRDLSSAAAAALATSASLHFSQPYAVYFFSIFHFGWLCLHLRRRLRKPPNIESSLCELVLTGIIIVCESLPKWEVPQRPRAKRRIISNQAKPAAQQQQIVRHFELQRPRVFSLCTPPPLYFCIHAEANSAQQQQIHIQPDNNL